MRNLRSLLVGLVLWVMAAGVAVAQSGGPSAGSGSLGPAYVQCVCDLETGDNSTGCYSTAHGVGHRPWSMALVVKVLKPAKDYFHLSLGQMLQVYQNCACTVTYLGDGYFRVKIGGGEIIILSTDDL